MGWRHFAHLQEFGHQVGTGFAGHDRKEQWSNLRKSGAESLEQLLAAAASHETWLLVGYCCDQWKCMVDWLRQVARWWIVAMFKGPVILVYSWSASKNIQILAVHFMLVVHEGLKAVWILRWIRSFQIGRQDLIFWFFSFVKNDVGILLDAISLGQIIISPLFSESFSTVFTQNSPLMAAKMLARS